MKSEVCLILLFLVFFTLGIMDTFSTVVAVDNPGVAGRESNALYSAVFANNGSICFIALKLLLTAGLAIGAYLVQVTFDNMKILYICVSIGLICTGIIVTVSNMTVASGGTNLTFLSLDTYDFCLFCLTICMTVGAMLTVVSLTSDGNRKPARALYRDQFGMWLPYDEN